MDVIGPLKLTRLFSFTICPGNLGSIAVTVQIPDAGSLGPIFASPIFHVFSWIVSALNVLANPTLPKSGPPYIDLTSPIP